MTEKDDREFKSNLEIHTQKKELNFPEFQGTNENLALNFIDNNNKKLNDDSQLKVQTKLARSKTTKFDFLLLDKDFFENDLCLCCISDKTKRKRGKILHDNADRKIIEFLDIETLFSKYQELDMMKKLLFDDNQIKLFETLSKITNLSIVFSSKKNEFKNLFEFQDKELYEEYFKKFSKISKRRNPMDIKLLENYESILLS